MKTFTLRDHDDFDMRWPDITTMAHRGLDAGKVVITLGRPKRTLNQNRKLWPMLRDVSQQLQLAGLSHSPEYWKNLFMWLYQEADWVPGLAGELVPMGMSTSELSADKFRDLIELIYAYGAEHGVEWSEESEDARLHWGAKL